MNTRIDKLWGQALDQSVPETWAALDSAQLSKLKAKFAELIVKECCDIFVELRTRPADLAVKDVKKHFGIKE